MTTPTYADVCRFAADHLPSDREAQWRAFDAKATEQEEPYYRAALERFGFEAAAVDAILRRATGGDPFVVAALARILGEYQPGGAYHARWLADYTRLISATVQVGGSTIADRVGFDFTLENPRVRAIIRQRGANLVQHVTTTTRDAIRAAVETGRAQGLGIREIRDLIQETVYGETITTARATAIARTETVGAMNAGEHESAVQSGVMRSKEWMHQLVGDSRPNHKAMDGLRIDIGASFPNGLTHPHAPGAPAREVVNCRCTLLYSDEEAP